MFHNVTDCHSGPAKACWIVSQTNVLCVALLFTGKLWDLKKKKKDKEASWNVGMKMQHDSSIHTEFWGKQLLPSIQSKYPLIFFFLNQFCIVPTPSRPFLVLFCKPVVAE